MAKKARKRKKPDPAKFGFDMIQRVIEVTGDTPEQPTPNLEGKDPAQNPPPTLYPVAQVPLVQRVGA
jgi:hypothetical protein